ncbi:MAG: 4Fe-4S binding protein [Vicinamibacterales bacterium]
MTSRVLTGLALVVLVLAAAESRAQEQPPATGAAAEWDFGDEREDVPAWTSSLAAQAPEIAALTAFAALALVGFFRKSERLKLVTLLAAVGYLGIYKSQLISITNIFSLLTLNLPILQFSMGWYAFAIFTVVSTILWGRLYCGRVCAFGSMTQLLDYVVPKRFRYDVPRTVERRASYIKYGILIGAIAYYLTTRNILVYRYVEPFWMFTGEASGGEWIGLGVLLTGTLFIRNLYCRFLCPVGAFLGLLSNLTVFRIKRWSECSTCRICEKTCEWGAIAGPKIIAAECVRCDDCERLYNNEQKCPHWVIIRRKSEIMARQLAGPRLSAGS